ncbi:MAG: penicillin acylase, partial [Lysobacterales bacterium CG_4_9_14_3_um_filter_62_6]
ELSALVGSAALPVDRSHRAHRFRARARRALAAQPAAARARIDAYRDGVNAGLAALSARPWEYLLLRSRPAPWRSEDSALVVFAMFFDLNSNGANLRELNVARLRAVLPEALVAFLLQPGSEWDAPCVAPRCHRDRCPPPKCLICAAIATRCRPPPAVMPRWIPRIWGSAPAAINSPLPVR